MKEKETRDAINRLKALNIENIQSSSSDKQYFVINFVENWILE
ncbi:hypothetical protein [Bacteroides difficilis]|nr:hypothetical protein [Bacteroides difficilis]